MYTSSPMETFLVAMVTMIFLDFCGKSHKKWYMFICIGSRLLTIGRTINHLMLHIIHIHVTMETVLVAMVTMHLYE